MNQKAAPHSRDGKWLAWLPGNQSVARLLLLGDALSDVTHAHSQAHRAGHSPSCLVLWALDPWCWLEARAELARESGTRTPALPRLVILELLVWDTSR